MCIIVAFMLLTTLAHARDHAQGLGTNYTPRAPKDLVSRALKAWHHRPADLESTTLEKSSPTAVPVSLFYKPSALSSRVSQQRKLIVGERKSGRVNMKGKGTLASEGKTGSGNSTWSLVGRTFHAASLEPSAKMVMTRYPDRRSMLASGLAAVPLFPNVAKAASQVLRTDGLVEASTRQGLNASLIQQILTLDADVQTLRRELEQLEKEQGAPAWISAVEIGAQAARPWAQVGGAGLFALLAIQLAAFENFKKFLGNRSIESIDVEFETKRFVGSLDIFSVFGLAPFFGAAFGGAATGGLVGAAEGWAAAAKQAAPHAPPERKARLSAAIAKVERGASGLKRFSVSS